MSDWGKPTWKARMFRVAAVISLFSTVLLLGGCSASDKLFEAMQAPSHAIFDKLPEWAGGPPKNLPPRPNEPGYAAYELQVEGRAAPATAKQAAPAAAGETAPATSGQAVPASPGQAASASTQKAALGPLY